MKQILNTKNKNDKRYQFKTVKLLDSIKRRCKAVEVE